MSVKRTKRVAAALSTANQNTGLLGGQIAPEGIMEPHLFVNGEFTAHSGGKLPFKIDCDALTDADLATLAKRIASHATFSDVYGIPRGGIRLAAALRPYCGAEGGLLLVDDVLTTGRSMMEERDRRSQSCKGVVIFARGPWPSWIEPIFVIGEVAESAAATLHLTTGCCSDCSG